MSEHNFDQSGEGNIASISVSSDETTDTNGSHTHGLLTRIGNWFRRSGQGLGNGGVGNGGVGNGHGPGTGGDVHIIDRAHVQPSTAIETRSSFLRPWARRDAAINQLQDGFNTLTGLMSSVRDHLDRQSRRQDELLEYLSHLPQALQQLPEANRLHGEALRAIHQQLATNNSNQDKLSAILEKLNTTGAEDRRVLDEVRDRVETIRATDQAIADNLTSVGSAMESISRNGATTSQVLEQMRDNLDSRDGQLERILHRQGTRFTTMLAVAIFLSIAALVAVSVIGYLLLYRP